MDKLKVGIILDKYVNLNNYVAFYKMVLDHNKISYRIVDVNSTSFFEDIKGLEYIIFRWGHYDTDRQIAHTILPVLEKCCNIKCFPDQATSWHFDDKVKQFYLLHSMGFPYVESYIFYNKTKALEWADSTTFPKVFKLKGGAGSKNVSLVYSASSAKKLIHKAFGTGFIPKSIDRGSFNLKAELRHIAGKCLRRLKGEDTTDTWQKEKNYVLFQKFLPNNEFDTRITVVGDRAFGYRRHTRKNDFRASGSGNVDYSPDKIDRRCLEMAFEISKKMKFQSMAYDFIFNENGKPEFCEISYTFDDRLIYNCHGYWDRSFNWKEGHYLAEYLHIVDLLGDTSLEQPKDIKF